MLVLHALGQCLIRTSVATITPRADMCFALASYLTGERGKRVPRRMLEKLFWPRMNAADASHSLSELVHKLRRKGVLIQRDEAACIWLPRDAAITDIDSLSAEAPAAIADRDLSILPGYEPRGSAEFNDWVDDLRDSLRLRVLQNVVAAIARSMAARDWHLSLTLADQALRIDAQNEPALLARARAADQLTRSTGAIRSRTQRAVVHEPDATRLRDAAAACNCAGSQSALATNDATPDDTPLVGRASQMERLGAQATSALHGEVCSAYVSAPAGIGKSRLVRELAKWALRNNAVTCVVSCSRHDAHRPLSTFVQAVPRLQALPGAAGCAPATIACLDLITQLASDVPGPVERADSLHLSASICEAVVDLADAIADEQPLFIIVEDVHWIDQASWSLLRTVAATAQRALFLVCTSRVRWQHAAWGEPDTFALEELSPLDASATGAHMADYLAKLGRSADQPFVDWCVETSGGNPYFIEELVNYWIATGEQYSAPPSLIALVEARLACLRPNALRVIQAAAILGKNSTLELLQQVLEFPTHVVFSSIEELSEAGLLAAPPSGDEATVAPVLCRHDLIIRAATRALSPQGRALLHHAAARAIEPLATSRRSTELFWDCADHWRAAGQFERSIRAVVACARHLHDMGLLQDSIRCCESALTTCRSDANRSAVLRTMAQSQYSARDWRAFCQTVSEVRALEGATAVTVAIHDDLELCELNAQRSLHRDWGSALETTLRCVRSVGADPSHRVQAAINALKLATNIGDLNIMDLVYREIGPLLMEPDVQVQDRLMFTMIYHTIRGDPNVSAEAARELLAFAERTLPLRHRLNIMLNCAGALRRGGSAGEAQCVYDTMFRSSVALRCFDYAMAACHPLIEMYLDSGQIDGADECVARYRRLRRPKGELRGYRSLAIAIARVHTRRGEWKEAEDLLEDPKADNPWNDPVAMFRSSAIAVKLRIEIGRGASTQTIMEWVNKLVPLNGRLRVIGAQDYDTYSLYLGYRYVGESALAEQFLRTYTSGERRDKTVLPPEIRDELARINLATPGEASVRLDYAEATGATST